MTIRKYPVGIQTFSEIRGFVSGTPTFLIREMQHYRTDITTLDGLEASASSFDQPTEAMENALPLLYQSGYMTIKDYDPESDTYILAIPNKEVRESLLKLIDKR